MSSLVLASTSPCRRRLLERAGIAFGAVAPRFSEEDQRHRFEGLSDEDFALELALGKARSVADAYPEAFVLGSDQVAVLPGPPRTLLHKPGTPAAALQQLRALRGRTHRIVTAVALVQGRTGEAWTAVEALELTMRAASDAELVAYVARDQPLDCAGSYRLEEGGILLFSRIVGGDHTAIVGLPMLAVARLLREVGLLPAP